MESILYYLSGISNIYGILERYINMESLKSYIRRFIYWGGVFIGENGNKTF